MNNDKDNADRRKTLDERLKSAERLRPSRVDKLPASRRGISIAFRMTTELMAAIGVGVMLGLGLDYLTGWSPLFLLVFFVMGAIAGFLNVIRASEALDETYDNTGKPVERHDED